MLNLLVFLLTAPSMAGAVCQDGWVSGSSGSGTCSHHGGVVVWTKDYSPSVFAPSSVYYSGKGSLPIPRKDASVSRPSVYETAGVRKALAGDYASDSSAPEPLDTKYMAGKLTAFPRVGKVAVVVSEGESCIVGLYEPTGARTTFSLAVLKTTGTCKYKLHAGDVAELLADQVLVSPTENVGVLSVERVTSTVVIDENVTGLMPQPISFDKVEPRIVGFPKAGKIAVVISAGEECVVGVYGSINGVPSFSMAILATSGTCKYSMSAGSVVEVLGDQVLVQATKNVSLISLEYFGSVVALQSAPLWARH